MVGTEGPCFFFLFQYLNPHILPWLGHFPLLALQSFASFHVNPQIVMQFGPSANFSSIVKHLFSSSL
jgi:hypothetical protein